jgi:hypothetical protein
MNFQPKKMATLRIPSGPPGDPERLHLWIILTDPCPLQANLIVSVSSIQEGRFHDPTCLLTPGEHKRVTKPSWVEFRRCKAIHSYALTRGVAAWLYHADEPVTEVLFGRICKGLLESEHTPIRMQRYFLGKDSAF